ncbi:hypothetical protein [Marinobacter sp.]|uniref:hypothetical protein n=1 Tax=Marinobacter sp. TaxID=50741 RepID=UPI00260825EA|nr:hypothetical protein [Marinobacter sp.]
MAKYTLIARRVPVYRKKMGDSYKFVCLYTKKGVAHQLGAFKRHADLQRIAVPSLPIELSVPVTPTAALMLKSGWEQIEDYNLYESVDASGYHLIASDHDESDDDHVPDAIEIPENLDFRS